MNTDSGHSSMNIVSWLLSPRFGCDFGWLANMLINEVVMAILHSMLGHSTALACFLGITHEANFVASCSVA